MNLFVSQLPGSLFACLLYPDTESRRHSGFAAKSHSIPVCGVSPCYELPRVSPSTIPIRHRLTPISRAHITIMKLILTVQVNDQSGSQGPVLVREFDGWGSRSEIPGMSAPAAEFCFRPPLLLLSDLATSQLASPWRCTVRS